MATGGEDMEMQELMRFPELENMETQEPVWIPEFDAYDELEAEEERGGDTVRIGGLQPEQSTRLELSNSDVFVTSEDIRLSLKEQDEFRRGLEDLDGISKQLGHWTERYAKSHVEENTLRMTRVRLISLTELKSKETGLLSGGAEKMMAP